MNSVIFKTNRRSRAVFKSLTVLTACLVFKSFTPLALAQSSYAQSVTVIGNTSNSHACFERAELATKFRSASPADVDVCEKALLEPLLMQVDRAATLVNRGILQSAIGNFTLARASYDEALELVDDRGETHINIANIYVMQKRYRDAVAEYSKGMNLMARRRHIGFLNRGLAYEYLKELDSAEQDYKRALELAPQWLRAQKMLERVKLKQSRNRDSDS